MLYLVTGGAGFIGSHIVIYLLEQGHEVRVIDNLSTGKRANLPDRAVRFSFIEGDIRDRHTLDEAMAGVDYVLHQAALPSVPRSIKDPLASNDVNITGTLQVFLAAKEAGVKRVVYAASSSAYGDTPVLPKVETMTPMPKSPYAVTKLVGELYGRIFTEVYGLETVGLRYFNVFGPRQDPTSQYSAVIPKFITALLRGESPVIYGDGEQSRDFTYVSNVVQANLLACTAPAAAGRVFNIACGERITLNELTVLLNEVLGTHLASRHTEPQPGDVRHSLADISSARAVLGYEPIVGVREGLRRTAAWYAHRDDSPQSV